MIAEGNAARSGAALLPLPTAWMDTNLLCFAESIDEMGCTAFSTTARHAGRQGEPPGRD